MCFQLLERKEKFVEEKEIEKAVKYLFYYICI